MRKSKFAKRKEIRRRIATERIKILMSLAEKEAGVGKTARSDRYVQMARKIGKRYNVRFPRSYKMRFCGKCGTYRTSATSRTRIVEHRVVLTCLKCGATYRIPVKTGKSQVVD